MVRRFRKRYLALRVVTNHAFRKRDFIDAVWSAVIKFYGEYGASKTDLRFIDVNPQKDYLIIRCSHNSLERIRASIASITEINGKNVMIDVKDVSGTLRTLRKRVRVNSADIVTGSSM